MYPRFKEGGGLIFLSLFFFCFFLGSQACQNSIEDCVNPDLVGRCDQAFNVISNELQEERYKISDLFTCQMDVDCRRVPSFIQCENSNFSVCSVVIAQDKEAEWQAVLNRFAANYCGCVKDCVIASSCDAGSALCNLQDNSCY